ncbi:MAG: DUF4446 family protein [Candidatus Pacebacteria bacterium]|jgi:hypothetical protein|nr:DUF4446 family protein [Candidatus Paceibacterota bacterium]
MSSSLGFIADNQDTIILVLMALVVVFLLLSAYLFFEVSKLKKNAQILFSGKKATDLEEVIMGQIEKNNRIEDAIIALRDADQRILQQLSFAVQKVGMLRFNPFGNEGGNQSFAVALLDNYNSGVIILSLYSRDGVRIYAKPVKNGKSEYQLSKEEAEALGIAMKR